MGSEEKGEITLEISMSSILFEVPRFLHPSPSQTPIRAPVLCSLACKYARGCLVSEAPLGSISDEWQSRRGTRVQEVLS